MMRRFYLSVFIIMMFLLHFDARCQVDTGFTLNGEIQGLGDGSVLYLILDSDTVATTHLRKGKFTFKGYVEGGANYYFIRLDSIVLNNERNFTRALWLMNRKMSFSANMLNWPDTKLIGSEAQYEYDIIQQLEKKLKTDKEKIKAFTEFIVGHPNSLYAPELLLRIMPYIKYDSLLTIYNNSSSISQNSFYGKKVGTYLELNRPMDGSSAAKLPNFQFKTKDNKVENIRDVIKTAEYTLIDFWASWCVPCLQHVPEMKRVFQEFKSKGFNIVGISIDKSESSWHNAINKNMLPWYSGIDNVMNANKSIFGLYSIPGYILVNRKGEIIFREFSSSLNNEPNTEKLSRHLYDTIDSLL